jgi:hypothetical protein
MRDVVILFAHLIVTIVRLSSLRSVVAESVLVKHQLLILNRGRNRVPNLSAAERIIAGLCVLFMNPTRFYVPQSAEEMFSEAFIMNTGSNHVPPKPASNSWVAQGQNGEYSVFTFPSYSAQSNFGRMRRLEKTLRMTPIVLSC